ncbi:MAG: tRNA lysidine(34) synthetase TilS [Cytophagales bacterium]|nr:tRNA lysidine(34) synthetase TilS [Cytophagales bacterium]
MFIEIFKKHITSEALFVPEDRLIATVSGGIDSVAMIWLLHKCGYQFTIAHCNFGLRGEESDEDEHFVQQLAKKYKVPFHTHKFDTQNFANDHKMSVQLAARTLRYAWFEELRQKLNYSYILTAHHQNDTLETVLYNLAKGTGIAGLHGIYPKIGNIIRPMLAFTKADIQDIVAQNHLTWREDSSNAHSHYARNLIRHEVIPALKIINPNLENTINDTVKQVRNVEIFFDNEYNKFKNEYLKKDGALYYLELSKSISPSFYYKYLKEIGFAWQQCEQIIEKEHVAGSKFYSHLYMLSIDRNRWYISAHAQIYTPMAEVQKNSTKFIFGDSTFKVEIHDRGLRINTHPDIAYLDESKLIYPLIVRRWQDGDWFIPYGMNGKKKISDFLIDKKVPLPLKSHLFVIVSGTSIVWLSGHRIDDRYKVTDDTLYIMKISKIQ